MPATGSLIVDRQQPGLIPQTLAPLLDKRMALKLQPGRAAGLGPAPQAYKARASAHKWLLVTCFGYLGYKNARFGRIEAHEAVTAYGREALLRAKEAAEDLGFTVLHMYVDGLWVQERRAPARCSDFQPLLDEIVARTGLPIALDGIYRWVAFLPSRLDERVPVANRYFGVFQDGSLKVRGIEARRRDTPPFIAEAQMELLELLAQAPEAAALPGCLPGAIQLLRRKLRLLRSGRVPLEKLLVSQKLSRSLEEYRTPSPAARAAAQLAAAGKTVKPGQRVRFLYVFGEPGVHAWDLPEPPRREAINTPLYAELLVRAGAHRSGSARHRRREAAPVAEQPGWLPGAGADELSGAEGVDQQPHIPAHRVKDRAGAAVLAVFLHLGARLVGRAGGGDAVDQLFRHQVLGLVDLLFGGRPAQDGLDLCHHVRRDAGGLGDVRLLRQVLGQQLARGVDGFVVIVIHRADDQLRAVDIVQRAARLSARPFPAAPGRCRCTRAARSS